MTRTLTPIIRCGSVADAALLTALGERTFYETFVGCCTPEDMQLYLSAAFTVERLNCELNDPLAVFLVAEVESEPAGYAKLRAGEVPDCVTGSDPIELERLYVEQRWLGCGVGHALMQACLDEAQEKGHQTMFLGVWESNYRAQAFYRKWGFAQIGDHTFMMGNDAQTDWWMEIIF